MQYNPTIQYFVSQYFGHNACSFYRSKVVTNCIVENMYRVRVMESDALIHDMRFLQKCTSYRCQRLGYPDVINWYEGELKDISDKNGFPLVLDYDDIMCYDDCPAYNNGKDYLAMYTDELMLRYMKASDYVTVTTDILKKYYMNRYNLPDSKFKVIDNYLPQWWFANIFNEENVSRRFDKQRKKPVIMISCGSSHFDVQNKAGYDDFTGVDDWIIANRNKYQFVFHGGINAKLYQYKDSFVFAPSVPINMYPTVRNSYSPNLYLMALRDSTFNSAKSAIRLYEADAEGIPILLSNVHPYKGKTDLVFNDVDELDRKVKDLFGDKGFYLNEVKKARKRAEKQVLENHIDKWLDILKKEAKVKNG